jgi:hypothetical protein
MADDPVQRAVAFTLENWDGLGIQEHAGVLHMPAKIRRRAVDGSSSDRAVMLRNVTNDHRFKCRQAARQYASQLGLDLDRDADYVSEIENYSLLAYAIREPKTFDQHVPSVVELVTLYDAQSLAEVWGVYNAWVEMLDPRFGELTDDQLWQAIARIAKEKTITPLVAMPGYAQHTCIVAMASQALLSPNRPSWLPPPATSRQASSPQPSSQPSSA